METKDYLDDWKSGFPSDKQQLRRFGDGRNLMERGAAKECACNRRSLGLDRILTSALSLQRKGRVGERALNSEKGCIGGGKDKRGNVNS